MSDDPAVSTEAEEREPGSTHTSAQELGDITAQRLQGGLRKLAQTVGTEGDGVDYYRFTLSEAREVRLGLKLRQGEAELYLEDAEGNVLARSMAHAGYEAAVRTLLPGTYYVRVEAVGAAASEYEFRYGVLEANASFRPASDSPWHTGEAERMGMPSFGEAGYGFELSETVDGRVSGVLLGTVLAVDPNGEELSYRIVGGNGSELFALGGASGELSYVGAGEDFEGGAGSYELTIRASDGTHTIDTTVTVTITDAAEAPAFGEESYAFALSENADGSVNRLSLGTVTATDPDSDAVRYSLVGGNDSSLFAIDETSGELFYVGAGEDYEGGAGPHELTVRASDGTHTIDATVTVTITDAAEAPAFGEESYAFALSENADGSVNRLSLGTVTATDPDGDSVRYSLAGGNDSVLFAIDETSGALYYGGPGEDYESGVTSYELTVRASDGTYSTEASVTVTVTDVAEAPAFSEESYAFELAENTDGSTERLSLGTVEATDPDGDAVRYSLAGDNASGLFAIDETSGDLYYVDPGEDYEGGVTTYELTVQASDGAHTVDTMVTVTVVDNPFDSGKTTIAQGSSEPVGEDLPAGRETSGEVRVTRSPSTARFARRATREWFAIDPGERGEPTPSTWKARTPRGGTDTAPAIRGLRDANGNPVAGIVGGTEVRYATDAAAAEAVYYVEVGGEGSSEPASERLPAVSGAVAATRGVVDTQEPDRRHRYRLWAETSRRRFAITTTDPIPRTYRPGQRWKAPPRGEHSTIRATAIRGLADATATRGGQDVPVDLEVRWQTDAAGTLGWPVSTRGPRCRRQPAKARADNTLGVGLQPPGSVSPAASLTPWRQQR